MSQPTRCQNCDAPLTDAYCAVCGQARRSPVGSLSTFLAHAFEEVTSLDSRLLRTVRALFLRPGHLTREYLDGRRVRYTQPVQLYLIAAALFFLMASYRPFLWIDTARREVIGQLPGISIGNEVGRERLLAAAENPLALELFAERFAATVQGILPAFLIGSVLLFSIILHAVNRRRDARFLTHAVFALHWTSFYLLILAIARLFPAAWMVPNLVQIPLLVYLTMALRQVYAQGMLLSFAKALLLSIVFILILGVWVQSAIVIGMRTV
jgi:hypothetical protein